MIRLGWTLALATGQGRAMLLAACTAVVSGLLLVTQTIAMLPEYPDEALYSIVADAGTRGGFAFGAAMLSVPALLLLFQAVRLGTSARERRLAALRLAGATPGEVRRLGAIEVGLPAFVGAVGGIGVFLVLRALFGGSGAMGEACCSQGVTLYGSGIGFVPRSVTPAWWQFVLTVVLVTVLGVLVGMAADRKVMVSPLGLTRRHRTRPPRPWGLLVMLAGIGAGGGALAFWRSSAAFDLVVPLLSIVLLVVGLVSLAPWTAYVVGRRVARRARTGPVLLAARRLTADPRPVGRAAAAVGGIGLVAGGAAAVLSDILTNVAAGDRSYYLGGIGMVAAALLVSLVAVVGSLAVHAVESLLDRKRSVASLAALGGSAELVAGAQRAEVGLVAYPMAVGGTLLGAVLLGVPLAGIGLAWLATTIGAVLVMAGLVWVAIRLALVLTGPWLRAATDPANLRTA